MKKHFKKLSDAIFWLENAKKFRPKQDLNRITNAFTLLNINLDKIKKIQVIGTNGKGSTTLFVSNILRSSGHKVGTFVSPYLIRFNERIKINDIDIDDKTIFELIEFMYGFNQKFQALYNESLIFFEMLTLIALKYFLDNNCDVIVMEAGIGGLLDSTSVLNYDVVCLTNVGLDHQRTLGNTKEEILLNKLGALKTNGLLVTSELELKDQIICNAKQKKYNCVFIENEYEVISHFPLVIKAFNLEITSGLPGEYQIDNILLSITATKELFKDLSNESIIDGIRITKNPGRLEYISDNVIIDGAHNISAMNALISSISHLHYENIYFLFSSLKEKEQEPIIDALLKVSKNIVLTTFPDRRIYNPAPLIIKYGLTYINDPFIAYKLIKTKLNENDLLIILGSIHFIGYMKKNLAKLRGKFKLKKTFLSKIS